MGAGRREISREISNCLGERGAGRQSPGCVVGWRKDVLGGGPGLPWFLSPIAPIASSLH